jgi:ATP-binding cassette subfamily B multidrug efflux pump
VREVIDDHATAIGGTCAVTQFMFTLCLLNALLLVGTAASGDAVAGPPAGCRTFATALPLAWQIASTAGWVSWEVSGIFENVGVVQEGMETIAVPLTLIDRPGARALSGARRARSASSGVRFAYAPAAGGAGVTSTSHAAIPGERIGLVGRSGAGKSTLVNLLLRFYHGRAAAS